MPITGDDLKRRFNYHPPDEPMRSMAHTAIREALMAVAADIITQTPASREQSLAITKLEEAMFWANAALARPPVE